MLTPLTVRVNPPPSDLIVVCGFATIFPIISELNSFASNESFTSYFADSELISLPLFYCITLSALTTPLFLKVPVSEVVSN